MTTISVYADWGSLPAPQKLGLLHGRQTRASERFEFQYDAVALAAPELAREVCEYFRLSLKDADDIIDDFRGVVGQWRTLAARLALPAREQERMADAFRLAGT
jgi:hypothetical protein